MTMLIIVKIEKKKNKNHYSEHKKTDYDLRVLSVFIVNFRTNQISKVNSIFR